MYYKCLVSVLILGCVLFSHTQIYAEGTQTTITREELANMVMETYEYITQEFSLPIIEEPIFDDISNSQYGFRIEQVYLYGFMKGVNDNKFLPNGTVTKSQAITVLYRLVESLNIKYGVTQKVNQTDIYDLEQTPEWATNAVTYMVSSGLAPLTAGVFSPDDLMDRDDLNGIVEKIKALFVTPDDAERIDFQTFMERMQQK